MLRATVYEKEEAKRNQPKLRSDESGKTFKETIRKVYASTKVQLSFKCSHIWNNTFFKADKSYLRSNIKFLNISVIAANVTPAFKLTPCMDFTYFVFKKQ